MNFSSAAAAGCVGLEMVRRYGGLAVCVMELWSSCMFEVVGLVLVDRRAEWRVGDCVRVRTSRRRIRSRRGCVSKSMRGLDHLFWGRCEARHDHRCRVSDSIGTFPQRQQYGQSRAMREIELLLSSQRWFGVAGRFSGAVCET